jgi:hypothetical protein
MEWKLPELEIINGSAKTPHDSAGDIGIVLITGLIYHVKVAHHDLGSTMGSTDVTQLVKELDLLVISVRAIHCS